MEHFLSERLGIDRPVIQAPMAGVQDHALAVAAACGGGLGSLPAAMWTPDDLGREIRAARAAAAGPINVNFFCHAPPAPDDARDASWREALAPYYAEMGIDPAPSQPAQRAAFDHRAADVVEELRPEVVSFHFGLPSDELLARVRGTGALVLSSATTIDEAVWLEAHGVDAVIAQGAEAGGHRGMFLTDDVHTQVGTFALLPQVVAAVQVPVIAAGGIVDARTVAAARSLGASAVQAGTAYLLAPEATTAPIHRAALQESPRRPTAITNVFTGRPARSLVNRLVRDLGPIADGVPSFPLAAGPLLSLRRAAEERGDDSFSTLWSGQNGSGCREAPAADITRALADGW